MAGPVLVGTNQIASSAAGTSVNLTLPSSVAAGNMIVVACATDDGTVPSTTCLDTSTPTMTWTRIVTKGSGSGSATTIAIFVAVNVAGGATVVKFVNGTSFVAASAAEFTNGQTTADGTSGNTGSTTIANPGTITSANADDTFFSAATDSAEDVTWVAGSGYTLLANIGSSANTTICLQYQSVSATQTNFATAYGTVTAMAHWTAAAVAIKLATGATTQSEFSLRSDVPNNKVGPPVLRMAWRNSGYLNFAPGGNRRRRVIC